MYKIPLSFQQFVSLNFNGDIKMWLVENNIEYIIDGNAGHLKILFENEEDAIRFKLTFS